MAGEDYMTCCNRVHVKTVTWVIAIVQLIFVGYVWVMGALYFLGITDQDRKSTSLDHQLNFAGLTGQSGTLIGVSIWLVFILLLMYGLHSNKGTFVLAHLISCIVMVIIFIAQIVTAVVDGEKLVNIINPAVIALIIVSLLWIEYRCYNYLRHAPSSLPH